MRCLQEKGKKKVISFTRKEVLVGMHWKVENRNERLSTFSWHSPLPSGYGH